MRLYHALPGGIKDFERVLAILERDGHTLGNVLISWFYYSSLEKCQRVTKIARDHGVQKVFLDCGAFSAHTLGHVLDLTEYERLVAALEPDYYVALDVIGDADSTRKNLDRMIADGFKPIPVFTRGAPWSELRDLCADFDYLALGNITAGRGKVEAIDEYLPRVFAITRDKVRLHAFGVTTPGVLLGFPFYSCDSSVANKSSAYGLIRTPKSDGTLGYAKPNVREADAWKHPTMTDYLHGSREGSKQRYERIAYNMVQFDRLGDRVTAVWTNRGVTWWD